MRAVGYIRVSTEGQRVEGVSLGAQEARIRSWADAMDAELLDVFRDEGMSGSRADNRPGLQAAIESACANKAAVVVYSLSRLCRSTRDAISISEKLDRCGADLVSLSERIDTTSASGRMIFRMLAVLSEFERDQISERTKAALAHKRAKGEATGHAAFGFDIGPDGKALVPNAQEQRVLRVISYLDRKGLSQRRIVAALNSRGLRTKSGGTWTRGSLRSVLRSSASRDTCADAAWNDEGQTKALSSAQLCSVHRAN